MGGGSSSCNKENDQSKSQILNENLTQTSQIPDKGSLDNVDHLFPSVPFAPVIRLLSTGTTLEMSTSLDFISE